MTDVFWKVLVTDEHRYESRILLDQANRWHESAAVRSVRMALTVRVTVRSEKSASTDRSRQKSTFLSLWCSIGELTVCLARLMNQKLLSLMKDVFHVSIILLLCAVLF